VRFRLERSRFDHGRTMLDRTMAAYTWNCIQVTLELSVPLDHFHGFRQLETFPK